MINYEPVLVTPPAADVLTLEEVKRHCRIELLEPDENEMLEALMASVISWLDGYSGVLGRALINQTWRFKSSCWPPCIYRFPLAPVSSVVVKYQDEDDAEMTLDAENYVLLEDALSPYIRWTSGATLPNTYDRHEPISVEFVAGYGATADDVPDAIKQAAKMLIAHWFENREASISGTIISEVPLGPRTLLMPFRRGGF